jgi:hypothetical protein
MESIDQDIDQSTQDLESPNTKIDGSESQPKKPKIQFVTKTKLEIKALSPVDAIQYEIDLKKYETDQLRCQLRQIKQEEGKTRRSAETRELIIWGRMVKTQVKDRPDRQLAYMQLAGWMDQYLTKDSDRELLGFPPQGEGGNDDN